MNYEDINIEKLINEDIQSISYAGARAQRKLALEKYYDNPNYCKLCGKIILVKPNQPVHDVRIKIIFVTQLARLNIITVKDKI